MSEKRSGLKELDWFGAAIPFWLIHLMPLGILHFGMGVEDAIVCLILYLARGFGVMGGFHRYFAHRSFKTSRAFQFLLAFLGGMAAQKGALWWAAHHRDHHKYSDTERDPHSPRHGFWHAHMGWFLTKKNDATPQKNIPDFQKFPELHFLNRFHLLPPVLSGITIYLIGGWPMLFGGFFLSTVLLYHGTYCINSVSHLWGSQRFDTGDDSRNSLFVAIVALGEGWHNNHHHYQISARHGFRWWEIDFTYLVLRILEVFHVIWEVRRPDPDICRSERELNPT